MEDKAMTRHCLDQILFGRLGPYPVAGMGEPWHSRLEETFAALRDQGVGAVLTLTEEDPFAPAYAEAGFVHHHEPIDDYEAPTPQALERALEFMDEALDQNLGVAVHCLEGRGRTGTVLCAWLARKEGLEPAEAIMKVRQWRPLTALSPSQKAFLLSGCAPRNISRSIA